MANLEWGWGQTLLFRLDRTIAACQLIDRTVSSLFPCLNIP